MNKVAPARSTQRTVELHVGGACSLRCPVCDCHDESGSASEMLARLRGGGRRLTLRGDASSSDQLGRVVDAARREGFSEVVARTSAVDFKDPDDARAFLQLGIDGVLVPLFAANAKVHDRIAGQDGALVRTLVGMRALASAGASVDIELPLLSPRLSRPAEVVDLAHRAVPGLRGVRFFLPQRPLPAQLAPPPWSEGAPLLAEALSRCEQLELQIGLHTQDGIPLCALREHPELHHVFRFDPRGKNQIRGATYVDACDHCAARPQCPGVVPAYHQAHGGAGLVAWRSRPRRLYEQRTTPSRIWTDDERRAAASRHLLVVRPTVNCNQDCPFCSANESSNAVWPDPLEMKKRIARAARHGTQRICFTGGEPTLSKHLASFIRVARRAGIPEAEIASNGVLLDRRDRVEALVEAGLTDAFISMHAHDEQLSRTMTQKVGDFEKTVSAIHNLIESGVFVIVNHVIGAQNYRYLESFVEFVHREFDGRVQISFALMTPQFKALMNLRLVPKMTDVMPALMRAMYRAQELGQRFVVGSRQGIPPCMLGEFRASSDILGNTDNAITEDRHQKQRGPRCDECRYANHCTGVWKSYARLYGVDELVPIAGGPFTEEEERTLRETPLPQPWRVHNRFEDMHPLLRDFDGERRRPPPKVELPSTATIAFSADRSRPLRVAVLGSGGRARQLARGAARVEGLSIDAVASPHAPDGDLADFGHAPAYRSGVEAMDDIRPEAVIVAAATRAHRDLVVAALERGIPVLLEKPPALTDAETNELLELERARGGRVMMAHNVVFAAGLGRVWERCASVERVTLVRRAPQFAPSSPRTWYRDDVFQTLYHQLALLVRAAAGAELEITEASFVGDSSPERMRLQARSDDCEANLMLDYRAGLDESVLTVESTRDPAVVWRRASADVTVDLGDGVAPVERRGSEIEMMLSAFRDMIVNGTPPPVSLSEGAAVMRATQRALTALEAAGAPFDRAEAPRHVASRVLRPEHDRAARR